jgi:hypothetical protein
MMLSGVTWRTEPVLLTVTTGALEGAPWAPTYTSYAGAPAASYTGAAADSTAAASAGAGARAAAAAR